MPFEKELPKPSLPPFLFRAASSSGSRGINTSALIDPLAGRDAEYHHSIDSIPALGMMLYDHINYQYATASEFSSWSASLLYVLVHANRKAHYHKSCEANVVIYVMDTRKLDPERVRSAVKLLKQNRVASKGNCLEQYAQGEFLIHGKLENKNALWHTVKFDDLMTAGLWDCFYIFRLDPDDEEKLKPLFQFVQTMRCSGHNFEAAALPGWVVVKMRRLAGVFGEEWEGVVMVALICMRKRKLDAEGLKVIQEAVGGMNVKELDWAGNMGLRVLHTSPVVGNCPEVRAMLQVLRMLEDAKIVQVSDGDA